MALPSLEKIKNFPLEQALFTNRLIMFLFIIATAKVFSQDLESNLNHYQLPVLALDPDIFESSEIGIKMEVSDHLSFTAAYFDSTQLRAARDSISGETSEIIGLQVNGLEFEVKGEINNRMSIVFGYTSLDGKTSKGGEPREIPDHTLSLFTTYKVSEKFGWGLGFIQQGESNIVNDKSDLFLPEFTRVDLGAYYQITDGLNIQLNIENLTDELYFPHSHSTHQVSVGEPLSVRVSARKTF